MQSDLECTGIRKAFGGEEALRGVDLRVAAGSFFALVGPSGCGKSTLLRIVGGHERADAGRVFLRGDDVTDAAPERRPVHTVFQHYALFPHLSVADNVSFALRMSGVPRADRRRRAEEALDLVRLPGYGGRAVTTLSGGERQRVALARAIAPRPQVLLLDEPLGALDLQLRRAMQDELRELQRRVGITFLHVTHDQEEAFRLADRVAVLRRGVVAQEGEPREVYRRPTSRFVAEFLGVTNLLPGAADPAGGLFTTSKGLVLTAAEARPGAAFAAVREERVLVSSSAAPGAIDGTVADVAFLGAVTRVTLETAGSERLHGWAAAGTAFRAGDRASAFVDPADVLLLPPEAPA